MLKLLLIKEFNIFYDMSEIIGRYPQVLDSINNALWNSKLYAINNDFDQG